MMEQSGLLTEKKTDIKSLTLPELTAEMEAMGEKKFRAGQLYQWMHQKLAGDYEEMTNIPAALKEKCRERFTYTSLVCVREQISKIDGTRKYLFGLSDGNVVESVFMRYKHGNSVCISSQVGCRMGCRFCASTLDGLERNLLPSEMLDQIYAITRITGERVSNVVVMGTGEPLDNYDNVVRFLQNVNHQKGMNIGYRHISLSTCGLVDKIDRLAEEEFPITLSVSLHAPNDLIRNMIMPVNKKYNVDSLIECCRRYIAKTGRRISFEYILIDGVNDSERCAAELAKLTRGMLCHINLIPANFVPESGFSSSSRKNVRAFVSALEALRVNVTVRRTLGADIEASCGQLRRNEMNSRTKR